MLVNGKSRSVLSKMEDLLKEELNVKEVVYADSLNDYVSFEVRPNLPVAGPKYGKLLRAIMAALPKADAGTVARKVEAEGKFDLVIDAPAAPSSGSVAPDSTSAAHASAEGSVAAAALGSNPNTVTLSKEDLDIRIHALEGFAVEILGDQFVILDTEIDRELVLEGIARELVSKVQTTRKGLGYNVTDHIKMWLSSDAEVGEAVSKHLDYVKGDTLTDNLAFVDAESLASVSDTGVSDGIELDLNGHVANMKVQRLA